MCRVFCIYVSRFSFCLYDVHFVRSGLCGLWCVLFEMCMLRVVGVVCCIMFFCVFWVSCMCCMLYNVFYMLCVLCVLCLLCVS